MIRKLHLENIIKSHKELLKDNRGGFLIPFEVKLVDEEYERYRHLPIDWSLSPITEDDLPEKFSQKAVKTVDMFRRKTYDLDVECMIYFDIDTGKIVSCNFANEFSPGQVRGIIYPNFLKGMHIASIHNHPIGYGSPPSGKNFEMLKFDFEEYELVVSKKELWVLESKDAVFEDSILENIHENLEEGFQAILEEVNEEFLEGYSVLDALDKRYGDFLLMYLNLKLKNINLTRRYLNG